VGCGGWRRSVIVVDLSAVVAILFGEASAGSLLARLAADPDRVMSVASYLETGTALAGRRRSDRWRAIDDLDAFLDEAGIALAPIDATQARLALQARIRFGRGMGHGGVPNFGDASSYALARSHEAPLLFTGDDFSTTDVTVAVDGSQRS
jgi:ribonuclease VapC